MRRARGKFFLPAAALLLAGCAAVGWRKPGMTGESYLRDRYACGGRSRTTNAAPPAPASEFLSFKQCMEGKGYELMGEMEE